MGASRVHAVHALVPQQGRPCLGPSGADEGRSTLSRVAVSGCAHALANAHPIAMRTAAECTRARALLGHARSRVNVYGVTFEVGTYLQYGERYGTPVG